MSNNQISPFYWLYCPFETNYSAIFREIKKYNIPFTLFATKIILLLRYKYMVDNSLDDNYNLKIKISNQFDKLPDYIRNSVISISNDKNNDKENKDNVDNSLNNNNSKEEIINHYDKMIDYIHNTLISIINYNKIDKDIIKKLIEINEKNKYNLLNYNEIFKPTFSPNIIALVSKITKTHKLNDNTKLLHQGMPHPHEIKGRPLMGFNQCYYLNCYKKFNNSSELKQHLLTHCSNFINNLHHYHAEIVNHNKLTPEYIVTNNITQCPSFICNAGKKEMTPIELCRHFEMFGIDPFWKSNTPELMACFDNSNDNYNFKIDEIYKSDDICIICYDKKPSIVFTPCMHLCICISCKSSYDAIKCPMCATTIDNSYCY
jgi:hypothetical protein